jgi:hypothetical protein
MKMGEWEGFHAERKEERESDCRNLAILLAFVLASELVMHCNAKNIVQRILFTTDIVSLP